MKTETKVIKTKVGLLNLAEQLGNVSQACKIGRASRKVRVKITDVGLY